MTVQQIPVSFNIAVDIPDAPPPPPAPDFETELRAAFAANRFLNWLGGDITLTAPIVLEAVTNKSAFGVNFNGVKVIANFNNAAEYAISVVVPIITEADGTRHAKYGIVWRGLRFMNASFRGLSPYAGAIRKECLTNQSWIYSWVIRDINVEGHTDAAFLDKGSVFEGWYFSCATTGGKGAHKFMTHGIVDGVIETPGYGNNWDANGNNPARFDNDKGLPSALYIIDPNYRDCTGHAIEMAASVAAQEPFDLTVVRGYLVTVGGMGIKAPAGFKLVDGTGLEFTRGGYAIWFGYRGGKLRNVTGANPVANASVSPPNGMKYLVGTYLAGGRLVIEDCRVENEGTGSGARLASIGGAGSVVLRGNKAADLDGVGPVVVESV